jgi:alanine racemase
VRVGIACYGLPPSPELADHGAALVPALSLRARITLVKTVPPGARVSYGLRAEVGPPGRVATVPAGYADGVPRNLGLAGGEVLVRGVRRPIIGTVTMDQLVVDLGDLPAEPDDEVVLIGRQGDDEITATEWAQRLGTISYEIVTGIGARVPRSYSGAAPDERAGEAG